MYASEYGEHDDEIICKMPTATRGSWSSNWTTGAALTGWIPGSAFFLTAADTAMIHQVAGAYERQCL